MSLSLTHAMLWSAGCFEAGVRPAAHDSSQHVLLEHRARRFYTPMSFVGIKREIDLSLEAEQPTSQRKRPSNEERAGHILNDDTINAALLGELRTVDGKRTAHKACNNPLPNAAPCFSDMWTSKAAYKAHLERFMGYSQEIRSSVVFRLLQDQYYCDSGPDGKPSISSRHFVHQSRLAFSTQNLETRHLYHTHSGFTNALVMVVLCCITRSLVPILFGCHRCRRTRLHLSQTRTESNSSTRTALRVTHLHAHRVRWSSLCELNCIKLINYSIKYYRFTTIQV
jgi:hypothetical protein